ncbi:MAG: ATP-binding protein [Candidatus Omnitrophota bacterium]
MAFIFFVLWLIVILKGKDKNISVVYSLFVANMTLWTFGLAMFYSCESDKWILFWGKEVYITGGLIASSFLYFSFVFPHIEKKIKWQKIFFIFLPNVILFALFFFTPIILTGVKITNGTRGFSYGPGHILFDLQFSIVFAWAFFRFWKRYKTSVGLSKKRLRYILVGTLIGVLLAGITNVVMPWLGRFELLWLGPILTLSWLVCVVYAIIRYHLLDIRIVIARALVFSLVYLPILLLPFLIGYLGVTTFKIYTNYWWIIPCLLELILAPSGLYVYVKIQKQIERRLKAKKLEYLKSMEDFLEEVKHIRGLNDLVGLVVAETKRIMGVEKAWVYLVNSKWTEQITKLENKFEKEIPETLISHLRDVGVPIVREELQNKTRITDVSAYKEMRELGISVLVPAMHHGELVCAIVLGGASGSKGESYDGEDIRAFNALGTNVALALKNAMYLEELNAAQADLIASERFAAIGRLAQSAKHEINNPINVISGKIQNLLMDIRGKEDNFKDVRTRLKPMVEDARKLMGELKRAGTLFAGEGEIEKTMEIFERAFKSLEERGGEEKSFKEKLEVHAKEIEVVQSFLLSAEEKTKDENEKELIRELDLTLNTIQINLRKIKDWDKILRDGLNMSYDHVKRITKVVEAIYHLPKETTGDIGPVVVREIIDESFEFTKYQTYWENLSETTSEIKIPENLPKIKAAGSRLVSVMSNIITNAYQAMTQAGITSAGERVLKIRANVAEDDKKYVEIGISNRGQELDKKVLNRMFDRGFSSKGDGRGLGLYICKIQIEQFNEGKIYCQNVKDFGPEFVIRLPVYGD